MYMAYSTSHKGTQFLESVSHGHGHMSNIGESDIAPGYMSK
jgi:hypothetical protein